MDIYSQGIVGSAEVAPRPGVVVETQAAGDTFWTAVKWVGGALVLIEGFRMVRAFGNGSKECSCDTHGEAEK